MSGAPQKGVTRVQCLAACGIVYGLAVAARLDVLVGVQALQDSVGPFWSALRLDGRAHAEPYGMSLLLPYWVLVQVAGSLWEAMNGLALMHALVSPITAWVAIRRLGLGWIGATVLGAVVAMDGGLIDTFQSGAEGYLAAVWIALMMATRGSLGWIVFAMAIGNHPLAVCGLPFMMVRSNFHRSAGWGILMAVLLVGTQMLGWNAPGVDSTGLGVGQAFAAHLSQGGLLAWLGFAGPLVGLFFVRSRDLSIRVLLGVLLLVLMGLSLGYLRDHHIRFMTVPAVLCWGMLPWNAWVVMVFGLLFPQTEARLPESGLRSSTLGLVNHLGESIVDLKAPMVVDRVWLSGDPGVEPSALMLDLHLRGWGPIAPGPSMVVVVSGTAGERTRLLDLGSLLLEGQGYSVIHAETDEVRAWSSQFCGTQARLGGAWDALSVLSPGETTESVGLWWECP